MYDGDGCMSPNRLNKLLKKTWHKKDFVGWFKAKEEKARLHSNLPHKELCKEALLPRDALVWVYHSGITMEELSSITNLNLPKFLEVNNYPKYEQYEWTKSLGRPRTSFDGPGYERYYAKIEGLTASYYTGVYSAVDNIAMIDYYNEEDALFQTKDFEYVELMDHQFLADINWYKCEYVTWGQIYRHCHDHKFDPVKNFINSLIFSLKLYWNHENRVDVKKCKVCGSDTAYNYIGNHCKKCDITYGFHGFQMFKPKNIDPYIIYLVGVPYVEYKWSKELCRPYTSIDEVIKKEGLFYV